MDLQCHAATEGRLSLAGSRLRQNLQIGPDEDAPPRSLLPGKRCTPGGETGFRTVFNRVMQQNIAFAVDTRPIYRRKPWVSSSARRPSRYCCWADRQPAAAQATDTIASRHGGEPRRRAEPQAHRRAEADDLSEHQQPEAEGNRAADFPRGRGSGRADHRSKLQALPKTIVELMPELKDYEYAMVANQVLLVDPKNKQVVEIIN